MLILTVLARLFTNFFPNSTAQFCHCRRNISHLIVLQEQRHHPIIPPRVMQKQGHCPISHLCSLIEAGASPFQRDGITQITHKSGGITFANEKPKIYGQGRIHFHSRNFTAISWDDLILTNYSLHTLFLFTIHNYNH